MTPTNQLWEILTLKGIQFYLAQAMPPSISISNTRLESYANYFTLLGKIIETYNNIFTAILSTKIYCLG